MLGYELLLVVNQRHMSEAPLSDSAIAALLNSSDIEDLSSDDDDLDSTWEPATVSSAGNLGESKSEPSSSGEELEHASSSQIINEDDKHHQNGLPENKNRPQCKRQSLQPMAVNSNILASAPAANDKHTRWRHVWRKRPFASKVIPPSDDQDVVEVATPATYFQKYFNEVFFQEAARYTNMYYMIKTWKELGTSSQEIKNLFGVHIVMGCVKFPRARMYWQRQFRLPLVADAMPRRRFFILQMALHVVDVTCVTEQQKANRLWKVQPAIDSVRAACLKLLRNYEQNFSIDEQMIPFSGCCSLKQYVPNKPRPVGLKNFVVATSSGLVLDFEIYQGKSTPLPRTDLGLGPGIVSRLAETLPQGGHIYFDRFFTTLPLLDALKSKGLEATGTIMKNRAKDIHFSDEKILKRGVMEEFCRDDEKIVVFQWKDSKVVTLASTATGCQPVENIRRWSKTEHEYVMVPFPAIVCVTSSFQVTQIYFTP